MFGLPSHRRKVANRGRTDRRRTGHRRTGRVRGVGLSGEQLECRRVLAAASDARWVDADISYSFVPDGTQLDGGSSSLFAKLNAVAPREIWQGEFERALQTWAAVSNLNFHRVSDDGSSSAIPFAGQQDPRFGDIRVGAGAVAGQPARGYRSSLETVLAGDVLLSSSAALSVGGATDLYSVSLRAIGESLGVDYSVGTDPGFAKRTGLIAEEITAIREMYRPRDPDIMDLQADNGNLLSATLVSVEDDGRFAIKADISTSSDIDVYKFVAPNKSGEVVELEMTSMGLSLLAPLLMVYSSTGTLVGWATANSSAVVDLNSQNNGLTPPVRTASASGIWSSSGLARPVVGGSNYSTKVGLSFKGLIPGSSYFVMAMGGTTDVFGIGSYLLTSVIEGDFQPTTGQLSAGSLSKSAGSYLVRQKNDLRNLPNYSTSDFAVEIAIRVDGDDYIGDSGTFIWNGARESAFNVNRPGWSISDSNGFGPTGNVTLMSVISDGKGNNIVVQAEPTNGAVHVVLSFENATKTLAMYVNGREVGRKANASLSLPSELGDFSIGSVNKEDVSYNGGSATAMPEFEMFLARVWSDDLSSDAIVELYNHWHDSGRVDVPNGISAVPLAAYTMAEQVGDANGKVGAGWLKDSVGGNHLKIVDLSAGKSPLTSTQSPKGVVRGVGPFTNNGLVGGSAVLKADGIVGTGKGMQYFFELDEDPSFASPKLRRSGWKGADGQWKPLLKPSTVYYWRVKGRDAVSGVESPWTNVYQVTTRAPVAWFVRPKASPGSYGREDGTSFADAWNDLPWKGGKGGLPLASLNAQLDINVVSPGDTVYVTGDWGLMDGASTTLDTTSPAVRFLHGIGLSEDFPIYVNLNHPDHPGRLFGNFYRYSGDYAWRSEGAGVFSTSTFIQANWLAVDQNGKPNIDMARADADTLLYQDSAKTLATPGFYYNNGRMYVRMPDDAVPGNRLWSIVGSPATFGLTLARSKYLHFVGGDFVGASPVGYLVGSESTHIYFEGSRFKYNVGNTAIYIGDNVDNWTFDGVEISYAANGIYGWATGAGNVSRTGDFITVKNSYIHHIGVRGWEDGDAHGVGFQASYGWVIEDNLIVNTGTAIENWENFKENKDHKIRRNVIMNTKAMRVTFGAGIALTGGGVDLGRRTGIEIVDNVIVNTEGSGIHIAVGDPVLVKGNLIMNSGTGSQSWSWDAITFRNVRSNQPVQGTVTDNVIYNPRSQFLDYGGNGDLSRFAVNSNVYFADPPASSNDARKFGRLYSFGEWVSATPFDHNSRWGDPRSGWLPSGFDPVKVDYFMAEVMGDLDGDADVDANDLAALVASPGVPRTPIVRLTQQALAK